MDVTASVLTVIQTAWTLSIRLKNLIGDIKAQKENVAKLEQKVETLATTIKAIENACGPESGRTDNPSLDSPEESIRRTVRSVTSRCRDDLNEFEEELSNILQEKTTGRLRRGLLLTQWRLQVAGPTFARIEKSIEGHKCSLELLMNVLHTHKLEETRTIMQENFTAVLASNERMLAMLHLLAVAPERITQQDLSTEIETHTLRRRGTDATLVAPSSDIESGEQSVVMDDNAQLLHQLFVRILEAWLNHITADKKLSVPSDPSIVLAGPRLGGGSSTFKLPQGSPVEFLPAQFGNDGNNHGRLRSPSSPGLAPTELPHPLTPTTTCSSGASRSSDLHSDLLRSDSTPSRSASSEESTFNQTASRQLVEAVMKQDIEWMNTLIDSELKPDIEFRDPSDKKKMTPLLLAVKLGHMKTVTALHSKGANIEAKDESGMTPFLLAAFLGKVDMMRELLDRGADVRARDKCKRTALHLAIKKSSDAVISFLLNLRDTDQCQEVKKVDVNAADKSNYTPLHYCAEFDKLEVARMLLDRGACLEAQDVAHNTPAYYAIKYRKYFIVELLLERGADFSWPWPSEPTSYEIEKLLKGNGGRRSSSQGEKAKGESPVEKPQRRASWLSLPSPKSRRKGSVKAKESLVAAPTLVHL